MGTLHEKYIAKILMVRTDDYIQENKLYWYVPGVRLLEKFHV